MVDQSDLQRAVQLSGEANAIAYAAHLLDEGGRIMSMMIGKDELPQANVPTSYMTYPPQMVATIKTLFEQRLAEIHQELGQLGVTGVNQPARV